MGGIEHCSRGFDLLFWGDLKGLVCVYISMGAALAGFDLPVFWGMWTLG